MGLGHQLGDQSRLAAARLSGNYDDPGPPPKRFLEWFPQAGHLDASPDQREVGRPRPVRCAPATVKHLPALRRPGALSSQDLTVELSGLHARSDVELPT